MAILLAVSAVGPSGAGSSPATAHLANRAPRSGVAPAVAALTVSIIMRRGESLSEALLRASVSPRDATGAAAALADDFDVVNPHPGLTLRVSLGVKGPDRATRLRALKLAPRDAETLELTQADDGSRRVRRSSLAEAALSPTSVLTLGTVHGSLYLSLIEAGVSAEQASNVVSSFGRRLDLSRDIESGDAFRLMFAQSRDSRGRAVSPLLLVYVDVASEAGPSHVYRFDAGDGAAVRWIDGVASAGGDALLRTPLDGARVTSAFGPRLHPLLGYTRMHQGVDFGAPVGTPVFAAADGVVEDARWAGGYGRWLKIAHGDGVETAYGHLSAWSAGVVPGARVRQGQIVAFVGATGLATGPHLHFEVIEAGRRIDPRNAPRLIAGADRGGPGDTAISALFRARRGVVDATVATLAAACGVPAPGGERRLLRCAG